MKFIGLARNIYRKGIVTDDNLLFDIMTLTFCNNHCQHLFICEIYIVNLNDNYSHLATYHSLLSLSIGKYNKLQNKQIK